MEGDEFHDTGAYAEEGGFAHDEMNSEMEMEGAMVM